MSSRYDYGLSRPTEGPSYWALENIPCNSRVLEFGCANGRLTKYLQEEKNCQVDIVELDKEAGKCAKAFAKTALLGPFWGDINRMIWYRLLGKRRYDVIVFLDVLEHLPDPKNILKKASELLEEDGTVYLSVPNIAHNGVLIGLFRDEFQYHDTGLLDNTHIHFFTKNTLDEMVRDVGLCAIKRESLCFLPESLNLDVHYDQISQDLYQLLISRPSGLAVNYLYQLKKKGEWSELTYIPFFGQLFYSDEEQFDQDSSIAIPIHVWEDGHFEAEFTIPEDAIDLAQGKDILFRFDLLEGAYVELSLEPEMMEWIEVTGSSAAFVTDEAYCFLTKDPAIAFCFRNEIPEKFTLKGRYRFLQYDELVEIISKKGEL